MAHGGSTGGELLVAGPLIRLRIIRDRDTPITARKVDLALCNHGLSQNFVVTGEKGHHEKKGITLNITLQEKSVGREIMFF